MSDPCLLVEAIMKLNAYIEIMMPVIKLFSRNSNQQLEFQ